jgi:hypothetical protein
MVKAMLKRIMSKVSIHELDRLHREGGIAVLCEDGYVVRYFSEKR